MAETKTLGIILLGKNSGVFKNDKGEYCHVSMYYIRNTQQFKIIFSKDIVGGEIATSPAINTTSEKKVLKLLTTENFTLVTE